MIILGLSDSHESQACLLKDGVVLAAVAEERLTRLKADVGYPRLAIDKVLEMTGISAEEIDEVAFAGQNGLLFNALYKQDALFSIDDWIEQCHKVWKPKLLEGKSISPLDDFDVFAHKQGDAIKDDPYYPFIERVRNAPESAWPEIGNDVRRQAVCKQLGIAPEKVHFYRHEDCHKIYAFHSSPYARERALIFTAESFGDDSCATLSTSTANGEITEHWRSNFMQLGRAYRYMTLLLGMKPLQHEYKMMGLAPYGTEYHGQATLEFYRKIHRFEGSRILPNDPPKDLYFSVRDALEGQRFDGMAWGIQQWTEELLCEWVEKAIGEHDCSNILFSGGVAQNIKACKAIAELDSVERFWTGPVSGDGSLGIAAAWMGHTRLAPDMPIEGLPSVYLGTEPTRTDIEAVAANDAIRKGGFEITENPSSKLIADWLVEGRIVSRCAGRMEYGQRALGNRSILADPRRIASLEHINQKIKYRDFWMPFTPSMMIEEAGRVLQNDKNLYSPFMTQAFDLKPEFRDMIPAAMHPADKSVRPQMLKREDNPGYYDIISSFRDATGVGAVLNTSFNLHGEPIVESAQDAVSTFLRSEIDTLLFDGLAISRPQP